MCERFHQLQGDTVHESTSAIGNTVTSGLITPLGSNSNMAGLAFACQRQSFSKDVGSFTSENLHAKCENGKREHAWPLRASDLDFSSESPWMELG